MLPPAEGAPATPAAFYKMLGVPEAVELILAETSCLPPEELSFQAALHHTLAADVRAAEPVPGFRASIKARGLGGGLEGLWWLGGGLGKHHKRGPPSATHHPHPQPTHPPYVLQDGYAVLSSDGPGEYEVAFEAFAGVAPRTLQPGTVAYIGTGGPLPEGADAGWLGGVKGGGVG